MKNFKKFSINAIIVIAVMITLIISYTIYINYRYRNYFNYLEHGTSEYKIFSSPGNSNKLTLFVNIKGDLTSYSSNFYIIEGEYIKKVAPQNKEYIKFYSDTGVSIEWQNENVCNLIAERKPEINKLAPKKFKVNLIVDRDRIRKLTKENKVYRYITKPFNPDLKS